MVIAFDIGNTFIHIGFFEDEKLRRALKIPSTDNFNQKHLKRMVLGHGPLRLKRIEATVIVSVVPVVTARLTRYLTEIFNSEPMVVSFKSDCRLKYGYEKPGTLGVDRIANAVGGLARYDTNLLIIDFGTATTFDVVFKTGWFPGGIIVPGIQTGLWSLAEKTAQLKRVVIRKPPRIIGQSTEACIQSGIFYGNILMTQALIRRITREQKKKFLCVATGGWGKLMAAQISEIDKFDPDLGLFGALKIYQYNR